MEIKYALYYVFTSMEWRGEAVGENKPGWFVGWMGETCDVFLTSSHFCVECYYHGDKIHVINSC